MTNYCNSLFLLVVMLLIMKKNDMINKHLTTLCFVRFFFSRFHYLRLKYNYLLV